MLLLLQAIIARMEADHDVWFDDGVSIQELIFALQKEIPSDACDEADAPSLSRIKSSSTTILAIAFDAALRAAQKQ